MCKPPSTMTSLSPYSGVANGLSILSVMNKSLNSMDSAMISALVTMVFASTKIIPSSVPVSEVLLITKLLVKYPLYHANSAVPIS
jgi:hypothetical protein